MKGGKCIEEIRYWEKNKTVQIKNMETNRLTRIMIGALKCIKPRLCIPEIKKQLC